MASTPTKQDLSTGETATPTLLSELRTRTQTPHRELERTQLLSGLLAADLSLQTYCEVLTVFAQFYRDVDACFATQPLDTKLFADYKYQPRSALLEADLLSLDSVFSTLHSHAVEPTSWRAEFERAEHDQQQAWLLGMAYVVEGSSQGASIIGPKVAKSLSLEGKSGLQFFTQQRHAGACWRVLRTQLNNPDIAITCAQRAQACSAAHRMFRALQCLATKPSQVS